jgi:frataxin-like iron-binding protein CyaY
MCSNYEQIEKLKCQIAKLQRRVCELECSRGFIINPQPCYPQIWCDTGTGGTDIKITNYTISDEYKC